ncbi:MAG: Ig-like domain-containing protein [Candidatus Poribacteria bacterium]|nr:Ig-like domain-containing protein [Candidatus Poribacteria bacterium]
MNTKPRNIAVLAVLTIACAWMAGCAGCNPEPVPMGMNPTQGPETGGTTVQITGEKFDMKNGVTVTFNGINAQSVTVPSETQITAVTPGGTAGQSVTVVVTNKGKPEVPVTLSQQFTYTDATPPTVTMNEPTDGTVFSEYEDSLDVMNSVSVSFSEPIDSNSVTVDVAVTKTEDSMSEPMDGTLSGTVTGSGDSVTFTSDMPMRAGRMYTVTVSGAADMAGNVLENSHSFSFSITSPEVLYKYHVREEDIQEDNGEAALKRIAARPEIFDNAEMWERLVTANQDAYIFDRTRLRAGQLLIIPRGRAWGDK